MEVRNNNNQRLLGLDVMRIVLAVVVFIFHSWCHMGCTYGVLQGFVRIGALTMTGFFMLSGFGLRYANLNKNLNDVSSMKKFYIKRMLGVLPLYYAVALVYTILWVLTGRLELWKSLVLAPVEFLGIQSMFSSLFSIAHNQGTWFISDILLCYLLFPWINTIMQGSNLRTKKILIICLWFIVSYSPWIVRIFDLNSIYTNPFFRTLEFVIGGVLCDIYIEWIKERKIHQMFRSKLFSWMCWVGLVCTVTLAIKLGIPGGYVEFNFFVIPLFALIIFASSFDCFSEKYVKIIRYASNVTYAFFLAQFFTWKPVEFITKYFQISSDWIKVILAFGLCVFISVFFYEIIEKRMKYKILKRFYLT